MGKYVFKVGSGAATAEPDSDSGFYDGPKPPVGVYNVKVKFMKVKTNKNDDPMLNMLLEITEKKGSPKAKYNGYGIFSNENVTDDSAKYVNPLLDALGVKRTQFWPPNGPTVDNQDPPNVLKIGTKRIEGCEFRVATKNGSWNGEDRLEVARYLPPKADEDDDEAVEEDDDEADESTEEEADEADAEDEDEEEEEEDEDAEEADEEEPLTEADLKEMSLPDLQELCDAWEITYTPANKAPTLIKKILAVQEEAANAAAEESDEEAEEEVEESDDEEEAEGYTAESLADKEITIDDLKAILTDEFEVPANKLPKPPIRARLVKAILAAQEAASGEPPF